MEALIGIIFMFNNFFTTYNTVEPPPVVSEDTKLVEQNYKQFLNSDSYTPLQITTETPFQELRKEDPLKPEIEAPITFDEHNTPDTAKADVSEKQPIFKSPIEKPIITKFDGKEGYVKTMYQYLYNALEDNGIDGATWAPVLVAHTSIESGWGNKFSRENNNFGGIKGKGSKVVSTKEWSPSKGYYTIKDTFKSYPSIQAFADDYVKKLKNKFKAFNGTPTDYLRNIRKHGYFTASLSDYEKMMNSRLKIVNTLLNT